MGRRTKPRLVEENLGYIWEEGKGQSWQGDDASIKRAAESAFKSFLFLRQAARRSLGSRVSNCPACHRASRHHRAVYTLRRGNTRDPRCLRKMGGRRYPRSRKPNFLPFLSLLISFSNSRTIGYFNRRFDVADKPIYTDNSSLFIVRKRRVNH